MCSYIFSSLLETIDGYKLHVYAIILFWLICLFWKWVPLLECKSALMLKSNNFERQYNTYNWSCLTLMWKPLCERIFLCSGFTWTSCMWTNIAFLNSYLKPLYMKKEKKIKKSPLEVDVKTNILGKLQIQLWCLD